jgi:hypothetical protein
MHTRCASALVFVYLVFASTLFSQGMGEPRIVRGPYLQALFHDTVEIRWITDLETEGRVTVEGPDGETFDVSVDDELRYRVVIDGLRPRTEYTYRIHDGDDVLAANSRLRFRTAPLPGEGSFRAVVVGDSGIASTEQYDIADVMTSFGADLFLHTGDILYLSDVDSGIFRPYRELLSQVCFFPSRGNHDFTLERIGESWRSIFTLPNDSPDRSRIYYSYDWGPAHFLVLDYYSSLIEAPEQDEFAVADLRAARARGVSWLIIYQHVPIFTIGNYSYLRHAIRRKVRLWCDEFDVDLVLGGHDHNYQRTHPVERGIVHDAWQGSVVASPRGTVYVVTGGGGARLYRENEFADQQKYNAVFAERHHCVVLDVSADELRLQAVGFDNEIFDDYTIRKNAPRPQISYLRGDANGDGVVNVADCIATLEVLFLAADPLPCLPAASGFDDGSNITITHPLFLLWHLFQGGPPPMAPYPDCGPIPGADDGFCYEAGC